MTIYWCNFLGGSAYWRHDFHKVWRLYIYQQLRRISYLSSVTPGYIEMWDWKLHNQIWSFRNLLELWANKQFSTQSTHEGDISTSRHYFFSLLISWSWLVTCQFCRMLDISTLYHVLSYEASHWLNKKLSCRRKTARHFVLFNILLSHSRSLTVIRNDTVA